MGMLMSTTNTTGLSGLERLVGHGLTAVARTDMNIAEVDPESLAVKSFRR